MPDERGEHFAPLDSAGSRRCLMSTHLRPCAPESWNL
ncbi:hypothetical protein SNARM312S_04774 [Streptomyces narbonensis]